MNTITIQTAQNIEVEYDVASLGDRIVGRIIDVLIQGAYVLIFMLIFFWGNYSGGAGNEGVFVIVFLVVLLPVLFYDLVMEQFFNGQSIGKKVMKIKVISLDGGQPTFSQYLLRWLFRLVDFSLTGSLGALISVAASENKQRIGDMVAGTTLIKTIPRTTLQHTLYVEPVQKPEYKAMYPDVIHLNDTEVQLIKDVLMNYQKTGNSVLLYQASEKIKQVLHIETQQEPRDFLYQLLTDYNHVVGSNSN